MLHSDINAIRLAMRGHLSKLKAIHGVAEAGLSPQEVKQRVAQETQVLSSAVTGAKAQMITPDTFDAMFGSKSTRSTKKIR